MIFMTNQIESMNSRLSKVTKNRDHFTNDNAAIKLRCLEVRSMSPEHGRDLRAGKYRWKKALNTTAITFPEWLPL